MNVPLGVLALAFGVLFLEGGNALQPGPFDTTGFVLAWRLGLLMYGVSEGPIRGWGSAVVQSTVAAGAILLAVLVVVELRKQQPLIDLRLLGNRLFRSCNGSCSWPPPRSSGRFTSYRCFSRMPAACPRSARA